MSRHGRALGYSILFLFAGAAVAVATPQKQGRGPFQGAHFIENGGQTHRSVRFTTSGLPIHGWFKADGVTMLLAEGHGEAPTAATPSQVRPAFRSCRIELRFLGASRDAGLEGLGMLGFATSYFRGQDRARWRTGVRSFERIVYRDLYNGIDVFYYGGQGGLKSDFVLAPHADPSLIRFTYEGAERIYIDDAGNLRLVTALGDLVEARPTAHQGGREIPVAYRLHSNGDIGFDVGPYDPSRSLTIDPLLGSTFLGSVSSDILRSANVDAAGNVYVTGYTFSPTFPTTKGAYDESHNGLFDCVVSKFDGAMTTLLASTVIGGSQGDWGMAVVVEPDGNVVIGGHSGSDDFPTTLGVFDPTHNGNTDNFILRLDSDLTTLITSTYIGGGDIDNVFPSSLYIEDDGDICIAGVTHSANYPVTDGAYDSSINGFGDGYVSRLNNSLTVMLASTFLGGSDNEALFTPVTDSDGNIYVTGYTRSSNFPSTAGAYDETYDDMLDAVVATFDSSLTTLRACTFLGVSANDDAAALALDTGGHVYIVGTTDSADFPATAGAYDEDPNGGTDTFVSRFDGLLTTLELSTFLGGTGFERARDIDLDPDGNVFVVGLTGSTDFPVTSGAFDESYNGDTDGFISRLDGGLSTLTASTFIGGSGGEEGDDLNALVIDPSGDVVIAGTTESADFPTTEGAYDESHNGDIDGFVARLDSLLSASGPTSVPEETILSSARLLPNRPNPARPETSIEFYLAHETPLRLEIHGVDGRLVRRLAQGRMMAGQHSVTWDGRDDQGEPVSSGIYFFTLDAGGAKQTRRMQLLK